MPTPKELEQLTTSDANIQLNEWLKKLDEAITQGSRPEVREALEALYNLTAAIDQKKQTQPHMEWEITDRFMFLFTEGFRLGRAYQEIAPSLIAAYAQPTTTNLLHSDQLSNSSSAPTRLTNAQDQLPQLNGLDTDTPATSTGVDVR